MNRRITYIVTLKFTCTTFMPRLSIVDRIKQFVEGFFDATILELDVE